MYFQAKSDYDRRDWIEAFRIGKKKARVAI